MNTTEGIQFQTEQGTGLERLKTLAARRPEARGLILLVVVSIAALIIEPGVFTSFSATFGRIALIGLVALGLTVVILMGELDLSVASTLAVCGVVAASIGNLWLGVIAALAAGLLIGIVNAFFVVIVGINSFIATLGMLFFLRGLAFVVSSEEPVRISNVDAGITFGKPLIGPLTPRMLIFIATFIIIQGFLTRMRAGRETFAVGGNRQAAHDAGIPVVRRVFIGFMISGCVAAMAGVINTLERTAADPTAGGEVLLQSFAAAIIGGIALTGGRGSAVGTLIGAAALGVLQVSLTLSGVEVDVQNIVIGLVLLLAVIADPDSVRSVWGGLKTRLAVTTAGGGG